jgi:nucleotide-binding universal stress UspA family protein
MIEKILLATDFSRPSDAAAQVAAEHARRFGARVHVLHVVWPGADPTPDPRLAQLAQELRGAGEVVTAVESGVPAAEIVRYATRHGIDLIVLGTHGRTGVTRTLIGSVAERVVRTAPCPVLTVPGTPRAVTRDVPGPEVAARGRCLVCATASEDLICEPCRGRIRGQAMDAKMREERAGRA